MKILIIDNYDSFVYNIVQLVREIDGVQVDVVRNTDERLNDVINYDAIVISPGPDVPEAAGLLMNVIEKYYKSVPMLGICLGFQALAQFFGAKLKNLKQPLHGHESALIDVNSNDVLYKSLSNPIIVGHYHSWVVDKNTLPKCLKATAYDDQGNLMSFTHINLPIYGVQYHPESIITKAGKAIIENFITSISKKHM
jgi:anthranilate synthase component 2